MTKKRKQFDKGIKLRPDTTAVTEEGEVKYDDTAKKIQYQDDSATRSVVSEDGTQTLTNKSIDADNNTVSNLEVDNLKSGVLSTDISASGTDTELPSAKAVRDHVAAQIATKDEASEISYDNATSGLAATDVQAALDETVQGVDDHVGDVAGAHAASAISNTPSGNLAATDVQAALNELQGDIDTNSTGLSDHLADAVDAHDGTAISYSDSQSIGATTVEGAIDVIITQHTDLTADVHGVGVGNDVVGTGTTQTLTNKTIDGATITSPARSDVKKDTKANLTTYAATASDGQTVYATDTKEFFVITDNALVEVGGGAGDVDYLTVIKDFDTSSGLTTEASGVNAGTFRLTHDAVSTEFAEKTITVTNKFKDKILALRLDKRSTAASGNFKVIVTDESNSSVELANEVISPQADGFTTDKKLVTFSTAQDGKTNPVASIKVRFEALAESGSPFSEFDDVLIELSTTEVREIQATEQETNVFSARIDAAGTILSQSESFLASVVKDSTGLYTLNFKSSFFTVAPVVVATVANNAGTDAKVEQNTIVSTTSVQMRTSSAATNTPRDEAFDVIVTRQGSDYKNITKSVERERSTFHEILAVEPSQLDTELQQIAVSISSDWGTLTSQDIKFAKDGKYLVMMGAFITSTAPAGSGTYSIGLPVFNGVQLTLDQSVSDYPIMGHYKHSTANGTVDQFLSGVAGNSFLTPTYTTSVAGYTVMTTNAPLPGAGAVYYVSGRFPIAEWQATNAYSVFEAAPDSKVEIPTSELSMLGTTARGTGSEAFTVKYDNISKIRGDAITVDNTNGTVITIEKDGYVNISADAAPSAIGNSLMLTLNTADASTFSTNAERLANHTVSTANFAANVSSTFYANAGDKIRVSSDGISAFGASRLLVTHQEQRVQVAVSNIEPQYEDADSMVRLDTANGYGSTNTNIKRFSNVITNKGSDITYTDDAALGASFTINKTGTYHISYTGQGGTNFYAGISLNTSSPTTTIENLPTSEILAYEFESVSTAVASISWSGELQAGDVVRAHTNGVVSSGKEVFTIARQGQPSIAEVDVTPFVDFHQEKYAATDWKSTGTWQMSATTTAPTYSGSATTDSRYRFDGTDAIVEFEFAMTTTAGGAAGSGDYLLPYPDGIKADGNKVNFYATVEGAGTYVAKSACGSGHIRAITGGPMLPCILVPYDEDHCRVFIQAQSSNGAWGSGNINIGGNNDVSFSGQIRIPVQGRTIYDSGEYERIYAIAQNENEFSARIANNGTASITSESENFIDSVVRNSAGNVTINFKSGFFSTAPSLVGTGDNANYGYNVTFTSISTTSVVAQTHNAAGSAVDFDFHIHASRQGADRKDLQRQLASLTDFPRVNKQLTQSIFHNSNVSTLLDVSNEVRFDPSNLVESGDSILVVEDDVSNTRTKLVATRDCEVNVNFSAKTNSTNRRTKIGLNGVAISMGGATYSSPVYSNTSANLKLTKGDYLTFGSGVGGTAFTTSLDTSSPEEVFLNVTAQAQELETVTSATLGIETATYTGYTSKNGSNEVKFKTLIEDTTDALISVDNTGDHTRLNILEDCVVDVSAGVSGSGSSGVCGVYRYNSTDTLLVSSLGAVAASGGAASGFTGKANAGDYILIVSTGLTLADTTSTNFSVRAEPASREQVFSIPAPKVTIITDEKSNTTSGGSSSVGWQTRDLNTLDGDTSFVSLSANEFTLPSGEYTIEAFAPAFNASEHKIRLYDVTNTAVEKNGSMGYANPGFGINTHAPLLHTFEINSSTTYRIDHYCKNAQVTNGLGTPMSIGDNEVYTIVKITKIR